MKTTKTFICFLLLALSSSFLTLKAQSWEWAVKDSDNGTQGGVGAAICVDSAGNSYITGSMDGYPTYFSSCGTYSNSNYRFFYIAKYNSSGICQWVQTATATDGSAIAIDRRGNLLVTGDFTNSASFGAINLTGAGNCFFVAKYGNNGTVVWVKGCPGGGGPVSTDKNGNVYIPAGGNGTLSGCPLSNNSQLVKLDSNGNCVWEKDTSILLYFLQTDSIGNSFICNNGGIEKYDSNGNLKWAKTGPMEPSAIGIDKWDDIFITAYGSGNISFGCDTLHLGSGSYYIAKFDMNGNCIWNQPINNTAFPGLYVDSKGNSYINCFYNSSASIGSCNASGGPGIFVVKLDSAGNCAWVQTANGAFNTPTGIACDYSKNCYISGEIYGNTTFGSITLTNPSNPESILVAKLNVPVGTGTGHGPVSNSTTFNIYPNPSAGGYNLEISPSLLNSQLNIYDTQGRVVFQTTITQQNPQINIPSLAKGMYYVQLITTQGQSLEKTIVQQ